MANQKAQFRDELDSFAKLHFKAGISNLKDAQRSDALTLCYAMQVRNALHPGALPDDIDDLRNCLCDGASDRSVDFIFRDDQRNVTIIQTKHRNSEKREDEADFQSFRKCIEKLCPETRPTTKINQAVLDLIADIEWETDNFRVIYLSLARHSAVIEEAALQGLDDVPNSPLRDLSSRSEVLYLSEEAINMQWRDVLAQQRGESPSVEILISRPNEKSESDFLMFDNDLGAKSYICLISAAQIHKLYNSWRDRLFNLNIRNYLGDNRTNKEIIATAGKEARSFYFYNNGVSAVASKVMVRKVGNQSHLICSDFSVINGAQTLRSISKAHTRPGGDTKDLRVLLRVSEFNFRNPSEAERLDNITKYNNTQNSMRISDFRSNDRVQTSILKYVQNVPAFGGKSYVYKNKRSVASERGKNVVKMDDFCRAIYSFLKGPPDFFGGLSHLYDTGPNGGYVELFGKDIDAISQGEFDKLFGIWLICAFVAAQLLVDKKAEVDGGVGDGNRKSALERKFLVFFAVGEVVREVCKINKCDENLFLKTFAKPKWQDDSAKRRFVSDVYGLACDVIVQVYLAAQKHPDFVHRNFYRVSETLGDIRNAWSTRRGELVRIAGTISAK